MSTGLVQARGRLRSQRGRTPTSAPAPTSTREVRLLGIGRPDRPAGWTSGACVVWLGRNYIISGQDCCYVHFADDDEHRRG